MAVALALYGGGKLVLEGFRGAEVALVGEVHDAPELGEAVLDGRAAHGDAQLSGDGAHGLALGGVGVLDVLGLVDDDGQPGELLQLGGIGAEDAVGGEEDVGGGGGQMLARHRPVGARALHVEVVPPLPSLHTPSLAVCGSHSRCASATSATHCPTKSFQMPVLPLSFALSKKDL